MGGTVVLLKLGGSLITEKTGHEAARVETLRRLAAEIAEAMPTLASRGERLLLGHGSGSFGHAAAQRSGIAAGLHSPDQLAGISATQDRAAALHRLVIAALLEAGLSPFSLSPSSTALATGGRLAEMALGPLVSALELGLLPVIYGDVVLDRTQGVAIASTEKLFTFLAAALPAQGWSVSRAIWMGETDGVYDAEGKTLPAIDATNAERALEAIGQPAGVDVTGGMRHRVETALALARGGIASLIGNGTTAGTLARALAGEPLAGVTRVTPAGLAGLAAGLRSTSSR